MPRISHKSPSSSKLRRSRKLSVAVYPRSRAGGLIRGPSSDSSEDTESSTGHVRAIVYQRKKGVDVYVRQVASATPMQIVQLERAGVHGAFLKDLSKRMHVPSSRMFNILGVPKATAEQKAAAGTMLSGRGGQAAVGMAKLLGIAQDIVANSTAAESEGFDAAKWLGRWIEHPQPSLGGRKPADIIDTPTGVEIVARLLGSIESGAFQ